MSADPQGNGKVPEDYRDFLCGLARLRLDPRLQRKLDAEDVVQDTLIEARAALEKFPPHDERQQKLWLRRILLNNLLNAVRHLRQQKRDVAREQVFETAVEQSSARLENQLAIEDSTPSGKAAHNEQALKLEEALAQLPERQRQAVVLKHYHGWSVAQIGRHLDATHAAVAGLLNRGLLQLREVLPKPE